MVPEPVETDSFQTSQCVKVEFAAPKATPSYDIVIGHGVLAEAGRLIADRLGKRRCAIVSDSVVAPLYQARLEAVLAAAGHQILGASVLPAGEGNKDFPHLQKMLDDVLAMGADRQSLIVALGGGVVGDMAGLAAALAMRGMAVVQIPTTLLAQVDSSVGGKTAIDTAYGKNTVGAFFQPSLVLADVSVLDSLPQREMRAGYAEVVKYGLIDDPAFFAWCEAHAAQLICGDHEAQIHAVTVSCAAKARIVGADEREAGVRALLNLGHTFGHALEAFTGYGELVVHGEAVSIGMVMAFRLSVLMGLCPQGDYDRLVAHLTKLSLPVKPPAFAYDVDRLVQLMAQDKKAQGGKIVLVLARGIGQSFICETASLEDIRAVWAEFTTP